MLSSGLLFSSALTCCDGKYDKEYCDDEYAHDYDIYSKNIKLIPKNSEKKDQIKDILSSVKWYSAWPVNNILIYNDRPSFKFWTRAAGILLFPAHSHLPFHCQ